MAAPWWKTGAALLFSSLGSEVSQAAGTHTELFCQPITCAVSELLPHSRAGVMPFHH